MECTKEEICGSTAEIQAMMQEIRVCEAESETQSEIERNLPQEQTQLKTRRRCQHAGHSLAGSQVSNSFLLGSLIRCETPQHPML